MRLRLLLSFALVIFVALGSVFLVANLSTEEQVRQYLGRSALAGVDDLVKDLEIFYEGNTSWEGVETVFDTQQATTTTETSLLTQPIESSPSPQSSPTVNNQETLLPGSGMGAGGNNGKGTGAGQGGIHATLTPDNYTETQAFSETPVPDETNTATHNAPGQNKGSFQGRGRSGHLLTDRNGVILYSTDAAEIGMPVTDEILNESIAITEDEETVAYLIPSNGVPNLPENYETNLIEKIKQATLIAAFISGGIAILLAVLLARMILKPVRELTLAAGNLSKGNLDRRVWLKGKNELVTLGNTFNQMAEALQAAEQQRRSMTADIAHELRTPLAVQRANLEAIQDGIYPLDLDSLTPIIEQNRLLTHLVEDLRTLVMADAGELGLNIRPFDLKELCTATLNQFDSMFIASKIRMNQDYQSDMPRVNADPERTAQILTNLLQNAYRYSQPDTNVFIKIEREGDMAKLTVRDQGPGIPSDSLEKIFERFYRVSKARERENGGTGLGLSIARKLAETQGGTLNASNHPEGGAVFTLRLPLE